MNEYRKSRAFVDEKLLNGKHQTAIFYKFSDGKQYVEVKDGKEPEQGIVLDLDELYDLFKFVDRHNLIVIDQ